MNKEFSTAEDLSSNAEIDITEEKVVKYLEHNLEFFLNHDELLSKITLPHDSGKAISLVEKQINTLREQGFEASRKLKDLLENARNNDEIFSTTRALILALLNSNTIEQVGNSLQEQFTNLKNVDACEVIFLDHINLHASTVIRTEKLETLKENFRDAFRLEKTHCGQLKDEQISYLFPKSQEKIVSTAICPVIKNGETLALLALGNKTRSHFNVHLDTLFLDFICQTLAIIISNKLMVPNSSDLAQ